MTLTRLNPGGKVILDEGPGHSGKADVVRYLGRKKK